MYANMTPGSEAWESGKRPKLSKTHTAALRITRVANQFLALAKNKNSNALSHKSGSFDFCELVRQVCAELLRENKHCEFHQEGDSYLWVRMDSFAFETALRNLVENAPIHGVHDVQKNARICITCYRNDRTVIQSVEVSGSGVPPEHYTYILEPFRWISHDSGKGAGLGLSIAKDGSSRYGGKAEFSKSNVLGA